MTSENEDNHQHHAAASEASHEHHPHHAYQEPAHHKPSVFDRIRSLFTKSNCIFLALAVVAVILAINYRITMLGFYGFYEPDGFYYFTAMRAIFSNGLQIPPVLGISGWPQHAPIAEAHGIYYLTIIPYLLLGGQVSYYTIMRLMPVLFGLLDMFGAYMLSRYISKDKVFGFFVLLFVALSMGNAARTSALVYRGDSFVTFFLIAALIFFVEVIKQDERKKKLIVSVAAAVSLLLGNLVWNGSPFTTAIFMVSLVMLISYAFVFRKEKLIDDGKYLLLSLLVWFVLVNTVKATGFITNQQLTGFAFVPIYLCLALFWFIAYYSSTIQLPDFLRSQIYRFFILLLIIVAGIALFALLEPSTIYNIFVGNGFVAQTSFASTTEELQSPTCQFLYTSFGANLFTALPNLVIALTTLTSNLQCQGIAQGAIQSIWTESYGIYGIILLLLLFIPYLFMQVYDSQGLLGGKPKLKFDATPGMIALMAFFIITAYLEMHVIRYNSLLSVPLAIISAFTIYWFVLVANNVKYAPPYGRFISIAIVAIIFFYVFYQLVYWAGIYSSSLMQADSINPQFISALQWLKLNSSPTSVVLTLWPDGSVVEGVSNRTSVMDSVGSENGSKATPFAAWLLNTSQDPQFLSTPTLMGSPNYLLVRTTWLQETQGIYTEANIGTNPSMYGYAPLVSFSESASNSTFKQIILKPNPSYPYPSVLFSMSYSNTTGRLSGISGVLQIAQGQASPFQQVVLYDQNTGNFSIVNQGIANQTNGEMLLLQYSEVPRSNFFLNLTGAYVFGEGIASSNMLKFLFLCNTYQCAWNNNRATLQLVYINSDTRIFKINYNATA